MLNVLNAEDFIIMGSSHYNNRQNTVIEADRIVLGSRLQNDVNAMILKGSIWVQTPFAGFRLSCGDIIGLMDKMFVNYSMSYTAETDVNIYPFVFDKKSYKPIFKKEPQFIVSFYKSYYSQLQILMKIYDLYAKTASGMYSKLVIGDAKFKNLSKNFSEGIVSLGNYESIKERITKNYLDNADDEYLRDFLRLDFYSFCIMVKDCPEFLSETLIRSKEKSDLLFDKISEFKKCLDEIIELYCGLGEKNLFTNYYKLCTAIIDTKGNSDVAIAELDKIITDALNLNNLYKDEFNLQGLIDTNRLNDMRNSLFKPMASKEEQKALYSYSKEQIESCMNAVNNLTEVLLDFADYSEAAKGDFLNSLNAYRLHQKARFNKDISRGFIKKFEDDYLNLYEKVYLQTKQKNETPIPVLLFLDYGLLNENYIEKEELFKLYHFATNNSFDSKYNVFTFRIWLDSIYSGVNQPSKNELDEDYSDYVRSIKKTRSLSQEEEKAMLEDTYAKIDYEIKHFFKSNLRYLFSSNATFCPFLNEFDYSKNVTSMINTVKEIERSIDKWLAVDYMLFYRDELVTVNHLGKYEKFNIQVEVLPNIIILPIFGQKGSMWQEIASHSRKEPARMTIPMYKVQNDDDLILEMFGKYKWEYVRTEMGARWNDITYKSLTSEYSDYILFFKKNKDLTDVTKNKIKERLVSVRNSLSDMFVYDYVQYIRFEATGSPRLNKVSRDILARYCPLKSDLRNKLSINPMFEREMNSVSAKLAQKKKEINNKVIKLVKEGTEIPQIVKDYIKVLEL